MLPRRRGLWCGWALVALAGCAAAAARAPQAAKEPQPSNVLRADYVGSAACSQCHPAVAAAFRRSPMHQMTRLAEPGVIRAPFDGSTFRFKGDAATMETHDGRYYMRLESGGKPAQLYRITKVIGGRYREDYVGVEVSGTGEHDRVLGDARAEPVMPVSWLLFAGTWRYKGYSVMVRERGALRPGMSWRQTCIYCHNTAPYFASLYDDLLDSHKPYQGSVNDRLLPASRRFSLEITDPDGLRRALDDEMAHVSGAPVSRSTEPLPELLERAVKTSLKHVDQSDLVEVGIGCESCHNGAREHLEHAGRSPSFEIQSPLFKAKLPENAGSRAAAMTRVCARCHNVLLSSYAYTWEGGRRFGDAGGSSTNSGEARDFLLGGCASAMSCTACHDPHREDDRAALDRLGTTSGNAVCVRCHAAIGRDPGAVEAHTHHRADSAGSACLACHMPRKNMGLAYGLSRYHRIGSPADPAKVEHDRPIECALCHADRTVASLLRDLDRFWGKRYDPQALRLLYGPDLEVNALEVTVRRGLPHEQVAAAVTLAERTSLRAWPQIAGMLMHDYPLARYFVAHAMEQSLGRPLGIDLDGDRAAIAAAVQPWLR